METNTKYKSKKDQEKEYRERIESISNRKFRVKKETLSQIEGLKISQFEKHMIQEGIKQVLFAQGTETVELDISIHEENHHMIYKNIVPKETIQFLLDYDMIEIFEF